MDNFGTDGGGGSIVVRERLDIELQLVGDAQERGWDREFQRHQRIAERLRCLLRELGKTDRPTDQDDPS